MSIRSGPAPRGHPSLFSVAAIVFSLGRKPAWKTEYDDMIIREEPGYGLNSVLRQNRHFIDRALNLTKVGCQMFWLSVCESWIEMEVVRR